MSRTAGLLLPSRPLPRVGRVHTVATASVTNGLSNSMGAWTEVVSSTSAAAAWLQVDAVATATSGRAVGMLLDVGIGGAGSEVAILAGIQVGMRGLGATGEPMLPCAIHPGSRIAVRTQINQADIPASSNIVVALAGAATGEPLPTSGTAFDVSPVNTGTSLGAWISSSAWTEVVAATPRPYRMLAISQGGGGDATWVATNMVCELGIGPSGSEISLAARLCAATTQESFTTYGGRLFAVGSFPAGTRVAYRCDQGTNNAHTVNLIGVP